ncbi:MAG: hypothetical protein O2971_18190 [Proteobacteria bacterium]|nr:hypothetical protein [Pseudomonadota bacterium]
MMNPKLQCIGASAALGLLILSIPNHVSAADSTQLHFQNTCRADVHAEFDSAVALLHSFEYPESTAAFNAIAEKDPDCAMAYWGLAMNIWHPLWARPSRQDLQNGASVLSRTESLSVSSREASYINALKSFFSSDDVATHVERAGMYEENMRQLYTANIDDPEAVIFYALALLTTADPADSTYAKSYQSASLLNWAKDSQPSHPGVLHYLIHAYDKPELAHLALEVAEHYAEAAPDSTHAQHMPSHIFTRLGLWEKALASNVDSTRSAEEFTHRANLPGHYDEGLHSLDYLMYAMLQSARDEEAADLLDKLSTIDNTDVDSFKVAYTYAATPARYVMERQQWQDASNLELLHPDFPWQEFQWAQSIHHFARGVGAARSNQLERAKSELSRIIAIRENLSSSIAPYFSEQVQIHIAHVDAWIQFGEGNSEDALQLSAQTADREDSVVKHPVAPSEVIPARELYADMLFESGMYAESLEQFQIVLSNYTNRLNALVGVARAAEELGNIELSEIYREFIRVQTLAGNQQRNSLTP